MCFHTSGGSPGGGGAPLGKVGSFNPALMVHGEQGIELLDEIPPDGV